MSREGFYTLYIGSDSNLVAEDGYMPQPFLLYPCSERRRRTVTDHKDSILRFHYIVGNVVFDSACFQHTRGGDDDTRLAIFVEGFALFDVAYVGNVIETERVVVVEHSASYIVVEVLGMCQKYACGVDSERTVYKYFYRRQLMLVVQLVQYIEYLLASSYGKRRNDKFSTFFDTGVVDRLQK